MATHTPGPWAIKKHESSFKPGVFIEDGVCGPDGEQIRVYGMTLTSSEEAKANARLIAAAPDLLEALEAAVRDSKNPGQWIDEARSAIAKATVEKS